MSSCADPSSLHARAPAAGFRALKYQYLLHFVTVGCLLPFQPVFLRERGLDLHQIGLIQAASSVAIFLTPVLFTLLADLRLKPRRLLLALSIGGAASLLALFYSDRFWLLLLWWAAYSLTAAPLTPLHDGLYFTLQKLAAVAGRAAPPYHRVRVWGTVGFILPSIALFWLLGQRQNVELTVLLAIGGMLAYAANALALPDTPISGDAGPGLSRWPTAAAANALFTGKALVFLAGMFLLSLTMAAFYTFHPVYLRDTLGIESRWLGLIINLGVAVEVLFMLGFGRLLGALGFGRLLVIGAACTALRMFMLALWPSVPVAVASQTLHGIMVITVHVVGPIYLNTLAEDRYRNSIHGLYAMLVFGVGRVAGNLLAGQIAAQSLTTMFVVAGGLSLTAALLFALKFGSSSDAGGSGGSR